MGDAPGSSDPGGCWTFWFEGSKGENAMPKLSMHDLGFLRGPLRRELSDDGLHQQLTLNRRQRAASLVREMFELERDALRHTCRRQTDHDRPLSARDPWTSGPVRVTRRGWIDLG